MLNLYPDLPAGHDVKFMEMSDGIKIRTVRWQTSAAEVQGHVVIVQGYREFIEKYDELIQEFLDKGYHVTTLDHRGQGLSDRMTDNREKAYVGSFDDMVSDLATVLKETGYDQGPDMPRVLVAHSMGGHVSLRFMHDYPDMFDRAILMSPMWGITMDGMLTRSLVKMAMSMGFSTAYAPGQAGLTRQTRKLISQTILTHDRARYDKETGFLRNNPDLYLRGATYGWLDAALESIDIIHAEGYVEQLETPCLVIRAGDEKLVDNDKSQQIIDRLQNVKSIVIPDALHEIYRESDIYRDQMWAKISDFLEMKS